MKNNDIEKPAVVIDCPLCASKTHEWRDVYYDSGSVLKKANKQLVAWCKSSNKFVLSSLHVESHSVK